METKGSERTEGPERTAESERTEGPTGPGGSKGTEGSKGTAISHPHGDRTTILVVEDEAIVAADIKARLIHLGYRVPAVAFTGEDALKKAESLRPDLVLMDIVLAGAMDGIQAAGILKERLGIPVVYLTAYADRDTLHRARATEPYAYILKPFNEKELHTNIEIALYRHRTERQLKESEEKFRAFFRSSRDSVFITFPDGHWIDFNDAMVEMFGYGDREDLSAVAVMDLYTDPELRKDLISRILEDGYVQECPMLLKRKDGTPFDALITSSCLRNDDGSVRALVGTIRDVTELRRAEEDRARSTRAIAEKNEDMVRLIRGTSAELVSPMLNIKGYGGVLMDGARSLMESMSIGSLASEENGELVSLIREDLPEAVHFIGLAIERMEGLVRGLTGIERIESDPLTMAPLDMNDLMEDVHLFFTSRIKERGVSVTISDLPECTGNRGHLNRAFSALFDNALKYFDPGRPGEIRISGECVGKTCVYSVRDNGVGIPEDHREKIFRVFHRTGMTEGEGKGFGLSGVKRIVERHGGWIMVESESGKGSTFLVSLPSVQG